MTPLRVGSIGSSFITHFHKAHDGNVLPLPGSLRGGAATKVVGALLSRGQTAETAIDCQTKADDSLNRIWRNDVSFS